MCRGVEDSSHGAEDEAMDYSDVYSTHLVGVDRGNGWTINLPVDLSLGPESSQHRFVRTFINMTMKRLFYRRMNWRRDNEAALFYYSRRQLMKEQSQRRSMKPQLVHLKVLEQLNVQSGR